MTCRSSLFFYFPVINRLIIFRTAELTKVYHNKIPKSLYFIQPYTFRVADLEQFLLHATINMVFLLLSGMFNIISD